MSGLGDRRPGGGSSRGERPGYGEENERYHIYRAQPDEADDYPGRSDLLVAVTRVPELFEVVCSDEPFRSEDFALCGEIFCYLKTDGSDVADTVFENRDAIERAMEQALSATQSGWLLGGANGLRYSYVDFAVTDFEAAVAALRQTLREGKISRRSWILYLDTRLEDQWEGIWDDTPPPPAWGEDS
jgi:hypothetical protein